MYICMDNNHLEAMKTQKRYWWKTIASFFLVLFTMPLGHALMRVMEDTLSPHAVNVSAFIPYT